MPRLVVRLGRNPGFSSNRPIVALQGLVAPLEIAQRDAAIRVRLGVIGNERDRAIVAVERLAITFELAQRDAARIVHFGVVGIDRIAARASSSIGFAAACLVCTAMGRKEAQRHRSACVDVEDRAAKLLRLGPVAPSVSGNRLLEQCLRRGTRRIDFGRARRKPRRHGESDRAQ